MKAAQYDVVVDDFDDSPTVQQERIDILRTAFAAVHADPEFRAEAESLHIDVTYRPPAALQKLVNEMFATPKGLVE
jgi:tripartite-type tricarboxylate transporter receptor subunit TctC